MFFDMHSGVQDKFPQGMAGEILKPLEDSVIKNLQTERVLCLSGLLDPHYNLDSCQSEE